MKPVWRRFQNGGVDQKKMLRFRDIFFIYLEFDNENDKASNTFRLKLKFLCNDCFINLPSSTVWWLSYSFAIEDWKRPKYLTLVFQSRLPELKYAECRTNVFNFYELIYVNFTCKFGHILDRKFLYWCLMNSRKFQKIWIWWRCTEKNLLLAWLNKWPPWIPIQVATRTCIVTTLFEFAARTAANSATLGGIISSTTNGSEF
jgi:hypothetical protein